jgi:hypothetical protein
MNKKACGVFGRPLIPHLAKNGRDMGHPLIGGRDRAQEGVRSTSTSFAFAFLSVIPAGNLLLVSGYINAGWESG